MYSTGNADANTNAFQLNSLASLSARICVSRNTESARARTVRTSRRYTLRPHPTNRTEFSSYSTGVRDCYVHHHTAIQPKLCRASLRSRENNPPSIQCTKYPSCSLSGFAAAARLPVCTFVKVSVSEWDRPSAPVECSTEIAHIYIIVCVCDATMRV